MENQNVREEEVEEEFEREYSRILFRAAFEYIVCLIFVFSDSVIFIFSVFVCTIIALDFK